MTNRDRIIDTVRGIGITAIVIGPLWYTPPYRDDIHLLVIKFLYSFPVISSEIDGCRLIPCTANLKREKAKFNVTAFSKGKLAILTDSGKLLSSYALTEQSPLHSPSSSGYYPFD